MSGDEAASQDPTNRSASRLQLGRAFSAQTWGDLFFVVPVALALLLVYLKATPAFRTIFVYDAVISQPDRGGPTIPNWSAAVGPLCFLVASVMFFELLQGRLKGTSKTTTAALSIHFLLQGLWTFLFVIFVAQVVNFIVGYPRPEFLARCQPAVMSMDPLNLPMGNVTTVQCTSKDTKMIKDGLKSFPSGHAALGAAIPIYLSVYILWALYVRPQPASWSRPNSGRWRCLLWDLGHTAAFAWILGMWCWAYFVGASRVIDNEHSPADVGAGWILGVVVGALYGFRAVLRAQHVTSHLEEERPDNTHAGYGLAGPGVGDAELVPLSAQRLGDFYAV